MFRENVLIALTVLVTILSLSFVILLTAYMQMQQMDEKIKRYEEKESQLKQQNHSVLQNTETIPLITMEDTETFFNEQIATFNKLFNGESEVNVPRQVAPSTKLPGKRSPLAYFFQGMRISRSTTENPNNEGIYTNDDIFLQFPQPPHRSRQIPYNLYNNNGHVTLEVPPTIKISNDVDQVKKVLDELNELFHMQKARDSERNVIFLEGLPAQYPTPKGRQRGLIWYRKEPATTQRSLHERFDDTNIFNIVANNRIRQMGLSQYFGKRKKRSVRESSLKQNQYGSMINAREKSQN